MSPKSLKVLCLRVRWM